MLKLREVFQDTIRYQSEGSIAHPSMQVNRVYALRDCLINPDYIVAVYPHEFTSSLDRDMIQGLDAVNESYCRIILDGNTFRASEIIVNSSYEELAEALQ